MLSWRNYQIWKDSRCMKTLAHSLRSLPTLCLTALLTAAPALAQTPEPTPAPAGDITTNLSDGLHQPVMKSYIRLGYQIDLFGEKLVLPRGGVIAPSLERASECREVVADAIPDGWAMYDIDQATRHDFRARLVRARTIVWNGPMGVFETPPFDAGTRAVAEALVAAGERGAVTIVGGGDSAAAVAGLEDRLSHVSTGGGASLELLEGKVLPGVAALEDA